MKCMFSRPMIVLLLLALCSCSKNNIDTGLLISNWNVVNDSSLNTNKIFTLSAGDSGISSSNYIGEQCPATFSIDSNGNVRTSYYNCTYGYPSVDSAKYVLASNQITIYIFAKDAGCCSFTYINPVISRTYSISNLTANTLTLSFTGDVSGLATEIINLKK